ncbi:Hypothetical protein AA314_09850 [Archangium gephyra]|uniref:Uncharacterized protein n=1 Tax=Archangium gephyra TaxID=48 RepID=A0AAC8QIM4_9BACT|nr:Hypothetical protein AA314_09850 [Archangium gephyra]
MRWLLIPHARSPKATPTRPALRLLMAREPGLVPGIQEEGPGSRPVRPPPSGEAREPFPP